MLYQIDYVGRVRILEWAKKWNVSLVRIPILKYSNQDCLFQEDQLANADKMKELDEKVLILGTPILSICSGHSPSW